MKTVILPRSHLVNIIGPLLLVVLASVGCLDVDATPEEDINPVGTTHTVSVTVDEPPQESDWIAFFFVIDGPNFNTTSIEECTVDELQICLLFCAVVPDQCTFLGCNPSDCTGEGDDTVSWTYQSNGQPGTDLIAVCAVEEEEIDENSAPAGTSQLTEQELADLIADLEEDGCDIVSKGWIGARDGSIPDEDPCDLRGDMCPTATPTPTPTATGTPVTSPTATATPDNPNVGAIFGGNLGGVGAGRALEQQAAAAAAAAQPPPSAVRPPNTGDAGLR
jgi:hypothetical protein